MLSDAPSVAAQKPRSMRAGARNVLRSNDSASLWNCTLSPGWTQEESEILRKLLIKFGVGNWAKIIESECLPGKTNAQMNLQMQRLLGQQSTAEFAGLHIDPKVVGEKNSKIQGPHVKRKNNTIVNTGTKLSREALRERVAKNKIKYELPKEVWSSITLADVRSQLTIDELLADDRDEPMSEASPHTNGNGHTSDAADSPANQAQDNHDDDMDDDDPEAWIDDDGPMPKKVQVTNKRLRRAKDKLAATREELEMVLLQLGEISQASPSRVAKLELEIDSSDSTGVTATEDYEEDSDEIPPKKQRPN